LAGYGGIYTPLNAQIEGMNRKIDREKKLAVLAEKIERLQTQCKQIDNWLPKQTDSKEWMQYMLDGIRKLPLKLVKLDFLAPRPVGPFQALVMRIEVEGSYYDLDRLLRWIETNPRLLRVDDIGIGLAKQEQAAAAPVRSAGRDKEKKEENRDKMVMGITVLGLGG
jgi:Tfp pilus assembly protein PilO